MVLPYSPSVGETAFSKKFATREQPPPLNVPVDRCTAPRLRAYFAPRPTSGSEAFGRLGVGRRAL